MSRRVPGVVLGGLWVVVAGCAPGIAPLPAPSAPAAIPEPARAPSALRVALPNRLGPTTWRVAMSTRLKASGAGVSSDEQRVETAGVVSWTLSRAASGGLRGTGQVDSFVVRSSLDTARRVSSGSASAVRAAPPTTVMVLLEATIDSVMARVATRPPLVNECDRQEVSAAALARELLVRVPDGVSVGERWRDSSVTLVCRSGIPMTVYATTWSTVETLTDRELVVSRATTVRLEGRGGSAFRALELTGSGTGTQRVRLRPTDGSITKLEGSSTMTLQLKETTPPSPARTSQLVQQLDIKAERISP